MFPHLAAVATVAEWHFGGSISANYVIVSEIIRVTTLMRGNGGAIVSQTINLSHQNPCLISQNAH